MGKRVILSIVLLCGFTASQAQTYFVCYGEMFSTSGRDHYIRAIEYSKEIMPAESAIIKKAIFEYEQVLRTDSLICPSIYKNIGLLYSYLTKTEHSIRNYDDAITCLERYLSLVVSDNTHSEDEKNDEIRKTRDMIASLDASKDAKTHKISYSKDIPMIIIPGMVRNDTLECIHTFRMSKDEITQRQWTEVMGANPSRFKGPELPVESFSYEDVLNFINELNRITGLHYRLPTKTEWVYAANGGLKSQNYSYSGGYAIEKVAWYAGNSDSRTHQVGQKEPNSLGLFDMSGNVSELCIFCKSILSIGGDYSMDGIQLSNSKKQVSKPVYSSDHQGIRLVLEDNSEYFTEEEKSWDILISKKRHRIDSLEFVRRRERDSLDAIRKQEEERERCRQKRLKANHRQFDFIDVEGGYNLSTKEYLLGASYTHLFGVGGFQLEGLKGLDSSWTVTLSPTIRLTNWKSKFKLVYHLGGGLYNEEVVLSSGFHASITTERRLGFWDLGAGVLYNPDSKELIPTARVSWTYPLMPFIVPFVNGFDSEPDKGDGWLSLNFCYSTASLLGISFSGGYGWLGGYCSAFGGNEYGGIIGLKSNVRVGEAICLGPYMGGGCTFSKKGVLDFGMEINGENDGLGETSLMVGGTYLDNTLFFTVGVSWQPAIVAAIGYGIYYLVSYLNDRYR